MCFYGKSCKIQNSQNVPFLGLKKTFWPNRVYLEMLYLICFLTKNRRFLEVIKIIYVIHTHLFIIKNI